MVIQLFKQVLGISNPYYDFTANITRISAILSSMEDNAKAANYGVVKEKTEAIKRMIGIPVASNSQCLIRLMQKKSRQTSCSSSVRRTNAAADNGKRYASRAPAAHSLYCSDLDCFARARKANPEAAKSDA